MNFQRQAFFWIATLAFFLLAIYMLSGVLLPFVAGMALAYVLDPLADRLERIGLSRLLSTAVILFLFALIFILFLVALVPILVQQVAQFAEHLPETIAKIQSIVRTTTHDWLQVGWVRGLLELDNADGAANLTGSDFIAEAVGWLGSILQSMLSGGLALVNLAALLTVTPVVAFYLLNDWDRMVGTLDEWLPREHAETIRILASQIDDTLEGFVRGQGLMCLSLGVFYAVGLSLVGLNFGFLIGSSAGMISFIPYVGSIVGFLVSITVALFQFWPDWVMVGAVVAVFFTGQFLEGNILQPKLLGSHVGLHPVWLIFSLFAFGYLFGFVGMLIAVPLAATIGVLTRFGIRKYLESPYYNGTGKGVPPP